VFHGILEAARLRPELPRVRIRVGFAEDVEDGQQDIDDERFAPLPAMGGLVRDLGGGVRLSAGYTPYILR
jgi:hypothetical protein